MVAGRWGQGGVRTESLMDSEFQFRKMKKFRGWIVGDGEQ